MDEVRAIMGPLEPIIQRALLWACDGRIAIRQVDTHGQDLIDEATAAGARAVIVRREEVVDLFDDVPGSLVVVGLSSSSWDALVRWGAAVKHVPNPSPGDVVRILVAAGAVDVDEESME